MTARRIYSLALLLVLTLGAACSAFAQEVTGTIIGFVRDSSGAVVPNATVTAKARGNGFSRSTHSGAAGEYNLLALQPGTYDITAVMPGFQTSTISNIDVKVNDRLSFEFALAAGSVNTEVTVEANALQVETTNTALGTTIESKTIQAMPLNGRSYLDLLALQPGVAPQNSGAGNITQADRAPSSGLYASSGNVSTDGMPEGANGFLINGAEVNETKNGGAGLIPNLDSIGEFRLITNSAGAEFGKFSGSIMNTVTKSGTNQVHGSAFEFIRNDIFDAKSYFNNAPGAAKDALKRHQFGGVIGGPLWKNHLFLFSDYQGTRLVQGDPTGQQIIMTNAQRAGLFNASDLTGSISGPYWGSVLQNATGIPYTGTALNPESYQTYFAPNTVGGIADIHLAESPVTKNVIGFMPTTADPGGVYSNASTKLTINDTNLGERVDFNNKKTGDWVFYYHYDDATAVIPLPTGNTGVTLPGFPDTQPSRSQLFVMSNTKTIGSTAVNVARFTFFRVAEHTFNPSPASDISLASLGFNTDPTCTSTVMGAGSPCGLTPSGPQGYAQSLPPIWFKSVSLGNNWLNLFQPDTNFTGSDNFSKTVGTHALVFGGEYRYYMLNARNTCAPNGQFSFNGNSETGNQFANFYTGAPDNFIQCTIQLLDNRAKYGGAFAQDSWKATPNFTVNYGLRWEVPTPWSDKFGRLTTPNPGVQSVLFPLAPVGNDVPGDPGVPATISPIRYNNFSPRIGLAWSPSGHIFGNPGTTSIRAAFGTVYIGAADNGNFGILGDAPFGLFWSFPNELFDRPYVARADGSNIGTQKFPFTFPSGAGPFPNFNFTNLFPLFLPGYYPGNKVMYAMHYNLTLQRQIGRNTVFTIGYVGTQGRHLQRNINLLQGDPAACQALAAEGATSPGGACGPGQESQVYQSPSRGKVYGTLEGPIDNQGQGTRFNSAQVPFAQASWNQNSGNSNYNSLQTSLETRSRQVTLLLSYTYSKSLDNVAQQADNRNFSANYGLSAFDLRHNFVASYTWNLPFYYLGGHNRLTDGWMINGITRFATGFPINMKDSSDTGLTADGLDFPNVIGPIKKLNPHSDHANHMAFDITSFQQEAPGTTGNAKQFLFSGPGLDNTDAGIEKDTKIRGAMALNIRMEFFNVFNHANFANNSVVGDISNGQFGQATQTINNGLNYRQGQISGKFIF